MLSKVRRILGNIKVTQTEKEIIISGIPADTMVRDISKIWKTSRINSYMFTTTSKNTLAFPLFFATDVYYMLDKMTTHRSRWTNVRTLSKIKDLLLENTWLQDTQLEPTSRVDLRKVNSLIYKPLEYQQRFYESYDLLTQQYHLRGYLLAAVAGSGKTAMGYTLSECLGADRIVVVCPKNATERVWEAEANKLFREPQTHWVYHHGRPYRQERIAIFHYEALDKALDLVNDLRTERTVVILDESHNLNDISSQRTQKFLTLLEKLEPTDTVYASGTPFKSIGSEAIPLLRAIDPYFTKDVEERFKKIYGRDGLRALDILQHRIGKIAFKVEKHQLGLDKPVMKKLPVVIPNGRDYTLTEIRKDMKAFIAERTKYYQSRKKDDHAFYDKCMKIHADQVKDRKHAADLAIYREDVKKVQKFNGDARFCAEEIKRSNDYEKLYIIPSLPKELRNEFKDIKSIVKYVNLKIQGEALGRILGRKRIQCHVDMVSHIDFKGVCGSTPKKTVVFTSFVEALEASYDHLSKQEMNPVMVYGKNNSELNKTIQQFDRQEDLNPLIATYQSLSTAVPLTMADTMVMINAPFRAYIREQAISRIHRLGADTQTTVWECFLDTGNEPNISTRSGDILAWSQQQVEAILGLKSPFDVQEDSGQITISSEAFGIEEHINVAQTVDTYMTTRPTYLDW